MARRFYMAPGIFRVSKAGFDAAVATDSQLLFAENRPNLRPALIGNFNIDPGDTLNVALPEPGFLPLVIFITDGRVNSEISYVSNKTILRIHNRSGINTTKEYQFSGRYIIYRNRQF